MSKQRFRFYKYFKIYDFTRKIISFCFPQEHFKNIGYVSWTILHVSCDHVTFNYLSKKPCFAIV